MAKSTAKKSTAKPTGSTLQISDPTSDTAEQKMARAVLRPSVTGAVTIHQFSKQFGVIDLSALVDRLAEQSKAVHDGSLKQAESLLMTQAQTLDAIFNNLAQKASQADYMDNLDKYLRLALKAQSQCRSTLQTLGEIKNPQSVAFVKQANISNGPQQVNNGVASSTAPAHAKEIKSQPNELLEAKSYEPMDTRAPSAASRNNQTMEAVGAIDGADNGDR